jgi:hypothetical protein
MLTSFFPFGMIKERLEINPEKIKQISLILCGLSRLFEL